jgi:predicted dehydrogenase
MSAGVLIVGFGRRGREWAAHVRARRGCEIAGVVDLDPAAHMAAEADGYGTYTALDDALGATRAADAIIATPPQLHASQAIACLEAGLRVLVEKPAALSLTDAVAVADAAERAGRPAVVGHNFRHRRLERTIRRALDAGSIGELRVANVTTARPAADLGFEHAPLWDLGIHHIDLLRLRLGGAPDSVDARCAPSSGGLTYSLHLEWNGPASADYWLREGASVYHHAEWLEGSRGALRAVDGRVSLVTPRGRPQRLRVRRGPAPERLLLDALFESDHSSVDARESLGTIATMEAVVRSLALGRPVRLSEFDLAHAEPAR